MVGLFTSLVKGSWLCDIVISYNNGLVRCNDGSIILPDGIRIYRDGKVCGNYSIILGCTQGQALFDPKLYEFYYFNGTNKDESLVNAIVRRSGDIEYGNGIIRHYMGLVNVDLGEFGIYCGTEECLIGRDSSGEHYLQADGSLVTVRMIRGRMGGLIRFVAQIIGPDGISRPVKKSP